MTPPQRGCTLTGFGLQTQVDLSAYLLICTAQELSSKAMIGQIYSAEARQRPLRDSFLAKRKEIRGEVGVTSPITRVSRLLTVSLMQELTTSGPYSRLVVLARTGMGLFAFLVSTWYL